MIFYHCTARKCFWWNPSSSSSSVLWPWVPSYLPNSDPLGRPAAKLPAGGRWCLCPAFLLVNCTCTGLWMPPVEKKRKCDFDAIKIESCYAVHILLCHLCPDQCITMSVQKGNWKMFRLLCLSFSWWQCWSAWHWATISAPTDTHRTPIRKQAGEIVLSCCHFQPTGSSADFC